MIFWKERKTDLLKPLFEDISNRVVYCQLDSFDTSSTSKAADIWLGFCWLANWLDMG